MMKNITITNRKSLKEEDMSDTHKIDLDLYKLIVSTLTESDDIESMSSELTQFIVGAMGVKGATIFILNSGRDELEILATEGLSIDFVNKGPILVDKSIKLESNREPVVIRDAETSDRLQYPEKARDEGIRSIVSFPINVRGKTIGSFRVYHSEVWEITGQELSFLQVLSQNIGMALMYFRLSSAVQAVKDTVDEIHPIWL